MRIDAAKAAEILRSGDRFLLLTHTRPDGDTLGSAGALCSALQRIGKTAWLYPNPETTEKYLPFVKAYFAPESYVPGAVVAVDVAEEQLFAKGFSGAVDLAVDHHPSNTGYAGSMLVDPTCAATGQLILQIIRELCGGLTQEEATLLYIAISTDTGCFQHSNTDAAAFRAAADTLDAGADLNQLNEIFFRKISRARLLLESAIYAGVTFYCEDRVAVAIVTQEMMKKAGATENDCDDLANVVGRIEGPRVFITIREKEDGTSRVSVRTGPDVDSCRICAAFGGGGHRMASGCTLNCAPEQAKEKILLAVKENLS
jgi:phosphoesterase RecJ-like protein